MHSFSQPRIGLWVSLILLVSGQFTAFCQDFARISPKDMGIDLPSAEVRLGGEVVSTYDRNQEPIVGQVYCWIGENAVILAPDGQLLPRKKGEFAPSDRKFKETDFDQLAKKLTTTDFPRFKSRVTRNFIFLYNTTEDFARGTSVVLETMLPGMLEYAKNQKLTVADPKVPLVVVMFATDEEFNRYQRMPPGVVAYYHTISNRVFLYEKSKLGEQRPDLAIQQAISTIAHEGAHQILHNIGVQQRLSVWPMWLSEGMAEYFAPTSVGARLRWKGAGQVNDMRMFELEQYVQSRASEKPDGRLIAQTVLAGRLTSTGYASAWSLTHFLAKTRKSDFDALVRQASKLGPLETFGPLVAPGIVRENQARFKGVFGDDLAEMEVKLVAHLKKQNYTDPFKDFPHFAATLTSSDARRPIVEVGTFHSPALAQKWLAEMTEKLPADQQASAKTEIKIFPNRLQAENYARQTRRQ